MATAHQIKALAARVEELAARLNPTKVECRVYLSFFGPVEADENGAPVRPLNWVHRYRDGVPVDEDGRTIEYVTDYSETREDLALRYPELLGTSGPMIELSFE